MRTAAAAWKYADSIKRLNGHDHLVFRVPEGTDAYNAGMRFATCLASEKAEYEAGGAVFVDRTSPRPSSRRLDKEMP